jgi:putative transposase
VIRFPNLIAGVEFTGVNQAWSSDITYYEIGSEVYYITFIIDLFSRKIVGHSVSDRLLTTHTTIPALKMALRERASCKGVIFHSDGGGQYYSTKFLELGKKYEMKSSMCDIVYENSHAERINGTIKNQYLKGYKPQSFSDLITQTSRAVYNYNNVRPHKSLKKQTPHRLENPEPAGGASLSNDGFCNSSNASQLNQKNHQLTTRIKRKKSTLNKELTPVHKTVNVF